MADRYLRANGNWNGPVWASSSSGVAGSASTPAPGDTVYTGFNLTNFVVNLVSDVDLAGGMLVIAGGSSVKLNGYSFTARSIDVGGSGTLDMTNSYVLLTYSGSQGPKIWIQNQGKIISSGSLLKMQVGADFWSGAAFRANGQEFNDVWIEMGDDTLNVKSLGINGSPTFRSLIIQSKNNAAHTVNLDGDIQTNKFVAIGASSNHKLVISGAAHTSIKISDTSYGQFVHMNGVDPGYGALRI